jgi:hypothetical protein
MRRCALLHYLFFVSLLVFDDRQTTPPTTPAFERARTYTCALRPPARRLPPARDSSPSLNAMDESVEARLTLKRDFAAFLDSDGGHGEYAARVAALLGVPGGVPPRGARLDVDLQVSEESERMGRLNEHKDAKRWGAGEKNDARRKRPRPAPMLPTRTLPPGPRTGEMGRCRPLLMWWKEGLGRRVGAVRGPPPTRFNSSGARICNLNREPGRGRPHVGRGWAPLAARVIPPDAQASASAIGRGWTWNRQRTRPPGRPACLPMQTALPPSPAPFSSLPPLSPPLNLSTLSFLPSPFCLGPLRPLARPVRPGRRRPGRLPAPL